MVDYNKMARYLGWFSLGLGLFEVLQPKRVQQLVDVDGDYTGVVRSLGVRELVHGLLILMRSRPSQGVWSRVVGDAVDLAVVGAALTAARNGNGSYNGRLIKQAGEVVEDFADETSRRTRKLSKQAANMGERVAAGAGNTYERAGETVAWAADRGERIIEPAARFTGKAADQAEDLTTMVTRFLAERFGRRPPTLRQRAQRTARSAARFASDAAGFAGDAAVTASKATRGAAKTAGEAADSAVRTASQLAEKAADNRTALVAAALIGIGILDVLTAAQLSRQQAAQRTAEYEAELPHLARTQQQLTGRAPDGAFKVSKSITVNRSPAELYRFWRDFSRLPQFMYHLQEVQVHDERRSHWVAKAPAGMRVEWDAEITEDRPDELIAWRSLPDADVPNRGQVRFIPGPAGRGTVVRVEIEYQPPAGALGKAVAKLFGEDPTQQVYGDLRRFKQVIETGDVVLSEGSPAGFGQKNQNVARPRKD